MLSRLIRGERSGAYNTFRLYFRGMNMQPAHHTGGKMRRDGGHMNHFVFGAQSMFLLSERRALGRFRSIISLP